MSFLKAFVDSSDDDDSAFFRHAGRNHDSIVAEQQRKKQRAAAKKEAAKSPQKSTKRKSDQYESADEENLHSKRPRSSDHASPPPSSSHNSQNEPISLIDDDDDDDDETANQASMAQKPGQVQVVREVEQLDEFANDSDEEFAEMMRKARREQRQEKDSTPLQPEEPAPEEDPKLEVFLSSYIPNTQPLRLMIRSSQNLGLIRQAWCQRQGFDEQQTRAVFLVHRGSRLYDRSTCRVLGLGHMNHQDVHKVLLHAVDDGIFAQMQEGALSADQPAPIRSQEAPAPAVMPSIEGSDEKINIVLRTKAFEDLRIQVRPGTSFSRIIKAYRQKYPGIGDQQINLSFDGDPLEPEAFVRDTDLGDMDIVEVHIS